MSLLSGRTSAALDAPAALAASAHAALVATGRWSLLALLCAGYLVAVCWSVMRIAAGVAVWAAGRYERWPPLGRCRHYLKYSVVKEQPCR